jgi:hypothetical protein
MTHAQTRTRSVRAITRLTTTISLCITVALAIGTALLPHPASAGDIPAFTVDASWPKPLPNNWILGQVGGITVDWQGHIWVIHRPRSLTDGAAGAGVRHGRQSAALLGRTRRGL